MSKTANNKPLLVSITVPISIPLYSKDFVLPSEITFSRVRLANGQDNIVLGELMNETKHFTFIDTSRMILI